MTEKKQSIFDLYERDLDTEEAGQWVRLTMGEVEVKIRSTASDTFQKVLDKLQKPHLALIRKKVLPEDISRSILIRSISEGLLMDWKGIFDREGNEITFSSKSACDLLSQKAMSDLASEILEAAQIKETFKREVIEDSEKNSEAGSDGQPNGAE